MLTAGWIWRTWPSCQETGWPTASLIRGIVDASLQNEDNFFSETLIVQENKSRLAPLSFKDDHNQDTNENT